MHVGRTPTKLFAALLPLAASFAACTPPDANPEAADQTVLGTRVHVLPWRDPQAPVRQAAAPAGSRLTYYGGRVVSNTQVVQVLWGAGSYLSNVSGTASPSIATFYQGVLNSAYVDWLDGDYNTVSPSPAANTTKSNQHIGRGSFLRQVTITPSTSASSISDATIQSELAAQIQAGVLPAPTHDAAGNNNTYYAVFFPPGKTITQGGSSSCVSGGFCAYHGTVANVSGFGEIYYGVHPDMQAGSGCATGCGGSTVFGNYTSVASHELIEMVTDPEVGLATVNGPPLAWYDSVNGEIGDICNAQQGSVVGSDGVTYVVQTEFSNSQNNCIVSIATTTANFSLAASPASLSVAQGASGSSSITSAIVSGSAQTITLSVSGAPAGVTATLTPSSISTGQSATLSLAASSSAAAGTYSVVVTGTSATATHTATVTLTVTTSGGGGGSGVTNGTFEAGTLAGWTASGASETAVSSGCHGGTWCARLGSTTATNGDSTIVQTFTAPAGTTGISLWYKETCPDSVTYDWALATLADTTAGTTATLITKSCATNAWTNVTGAITAGHVYTLTLTSHDDNYASDPTYTLYDDVALTSAAPPPSGITNGGFESALTGWTSAGASVTVVAGGHSGASAVRLGNTTATNGDSSVSQTFTVPSGKSQLSFWYKSTCPDTVTYDWATVTLKTGTTTTTVLAKTCSTNAAWVNLTAAVTAGASYTLTLTSHDDNYASDPTYTLFDDVVLN